MLLAFNDFIRKMCTTRKSNNLFINMIFLLLLLNTTFADSSRNLTPARLLAKQTGATLFEEEHYETHTDCSDPNHQVKKRSSDEDADYEVYQGVVGRPGIDFPIYPRIPKTSFSCRSFGNGYFADMETECQVFHICEDGRKISFLCPNGTIFQQSELTCDWWFKVNCLGSQGYYAESAELLSKQRVQRIRPSVPVQGFNIVGGATSSGLDIKPKVVSSTPRPHLDDSSGRRVDSSETPSMESVDFEDISVEKQLKERQSSKVLSDIDNNNSDNESQITAETASFVGSNRRNKYTNDKAAAEKERKHSSDSRVSAKHGGSRRSHSDRGSQRRGHLSNSQNNRNELNERPRQSQRGKQRFREEKKPLAESYESGEERDQKKMLVLPEKLIQSAFPSDISTKFNNQMDVTADAEVSPEYYEAPSAHNLPKSPPTTATYNIGTYSTARRLDHTRTTPFYTPTVPSVAKSKTTEGNAFYVKSGLVATIPNPKPSKAGSGSSLLVESSASPKPTAATRTPTLASSERDSTQRPFIIGMRHNNQETIAAVDSNTLRTNIQSADLPPLKANSGDFPQTTTATPINGPTYLPKSASSAKSNNAAAAGGSLLFAPSPLNDESIRRNVDDMLKTMNLLKTSMESNKLRGVEERGFHVQVREGLEIPPSSGPDALVSLAKYFANEQNDSTANSLNAFGNSEKPRKSNLASSATNTASISTTVLRSADSNLTSASPAVSVKSDGIKSSLLSEKTVKQYSSLFGLQQGRQRPADPSEGLLSNVKAPETNGKTNKVVVKNPFPQIGSTDSTIRSLAGKPESRKIAQVFSNALTTYLENPISFREQLASARPTEPPTVDDSNLQIVSTVTKSILLKSSTDTPNVSTKSASTQDISAPVTRSIAAEINTNFDSSTQVSDFGSTSELSDSTTYKPSADKREKQLKLELSAELLPPSSESGEGEEFLQREQTQAFVKSRNELELAKSISQKKKNKAGLSAAYVTDPKPTENPWNQISQGDFLDPLTINDGLMKEQRTTTISPFTYLPKELTTPSSVGSRFDRVSSKQELLSKHSQRGHHDSKETPSSHSSQYRHTLESESWRDIFNSYDLPLDTLPSNSGLQRIANKLFGGLNETEALHLKNVMQQAEHNRQVLSLLLLLIQTCDDQNGKALERSRKHLLNALIDMDSKLQHGKTSHHRSVEKNATSFTTTTTSRVPVTTFRRSSEDFVTSTLAYPSTTPELPTTTLGSTTSMPGSVEETTKFEIRVEDLDEDVAAAATSEPARNSSDQRALELLKSLYSLASKFTSRR